MRRDSAPGEYVEFVYYLKPGAGPEYDRRHAEVWPELIEKIGEAGIEDYRIWRHGDVVVGRMRTRNGIAAASAFMAATEVQKAWTASLLHLFERYQTEDGEPLWLDEVFRFDGAGS